MYCYDKKAVGRRIKSGIADLGLDQPTFAARIGVSRETLNNWCCGRTNISFENATIIAEALNWSLDKLAVRELPYEPPRAA